MQFPGESAAAERRADRHRHGQLRQTAGGLRDPPQWLTDCCCRSTSLLPMSSQAILLFSDASQQLQFRTLQLTRPLIVESLQLHAAAVHWLPRMKDYYERMAAEGREKAEAQLLELERHSQSDSVSAERRVALEAESSGVRLQLEQRDARLQRLMRLHPTALASIQQLRQAAAPLNELNDASASWSAFRRLCVLGAMAAALLDALDDHGLHEWGQLQQLNSRLRKLMADISRALRSMLPHVTGEQEQQQGLVRALLGIGEVGLAMKLTQRLQPTTGLNPPLGGELSALQRLALYDSPLDLRLILMLLPHGLDPSDGRLAHPERRSAIDVAREVAASEEAAVVPPPHEHGAIGSRSPHSMLISRAELPLDEKPHQRIRLAHRMRVRFCVDLVRAWQLHSDSIREELKQHTPLSNLALACIAEYLDLEALQQMQVESGAAPQIELDHANDDPTQRPHEAERQGEPSTAPSNGQHPQTALSPVTEQTAGPEPAQPNSASPSTLQQPSPEQPDEPSELHTDAESTSQQLPVVLADPLHCVDAAGLADLEQQLASLNAEVEAEERALAETDQQPSLQDVASLAELNATLSDKVDRPSFPDGAASHHDSADSDPHLSGHDRPPPLSTSLLSDCRLHTVIEEGQDDESASISVDSSSVEVSTPDGDGSAEAAAAVSDEAEASDRDGAAWSDAAEADAESDAATPSAERSRVEIDELDQNDAVISEWLDSIDD